MKAHSVVAPARLARLTALLLFVILATANSGGYRYGVGDQAFYQPATALRLDPGLFPRDRALIESQARLTIVDEVMATASRVTRLDLPQLFLTLYLVTLIATFFASAQLARVVGLSETATAVFLLLLTLRHRIAKTGANTLEGYMHPRHLAFALGIFALTASFKRRWPLMLLCWAAAAAIHPTTAMWWALAIASGITLTTARRRWLILLLLFAAALAGPVVVRSFGLETMDEQWLKVLENKDYLFPSEWPLYAWVINLAYFPLILLISKAKHDDRFTAPAFALLIAFGCTYAVVESRVALAVQLQISRVFWLMDFFLAIVAAWFLIDRARPEWFRKAVVAAILLLSIGRGIFTLLKDPRDSRAPVQINLQANDWTETMAWLRGQPADWLILAHPDHAWLYGTSVRVAANRDVVVESVKDSAISMYDRTVAMRTAERLAALPAYDEMTALEATALGRRYGAAVVVTETAHPLDLPLLHRNSTFAVYDLRGTNRGQ